MSGLSGLLLPGVLFARTGAGGLLPDLGRGGGCFDEGNMSASWLNVRAMMNSAWISPSDTLN